MSAGPAVEVPPYSRPADLPIFAAPPVAEVVAALHFLASPVRAVHLGLLWEKFRAEYPLTEDHPPIANEVESFGAEQPPSVQFRLLNMPPVPLVVFLAADRTRLVQVQSDRFQCAWRQGQAADPYPRYSKLREDFVRNAQVLSAFAENEGLGNLVVSQAEISFVNDVALPDGASLADVVSLVPTPVHGASRSSHLPRPDLLRVAERFTFTNDDEVPYSRLHLVAEPGWTGGKRTTRLTLTYRGEPFTGRQVANPLASVMEFLDEGHDRIVRAFAESTTPEMHRAWRRQQ